MIPALSTIWSPTARELCDHLWQSTLFAVIVALLALALRRYPARARYWLWLAASAKFLIPFSLLIAIGAHIPRPTHTTPTQTTAYLAMDELSQPFADSTLTAPIPAPAPTTHHLTLPTVFAALWLCGVLAVLTRWLIQWRRIAITIRNATPLLTGRVPETLRRIEHLARISRPIPILSSPGSLEPGVFGVLRPVLLWPEAISSHLDDAHLEAVLAHEAAHVRRHDNLTALLPMLIEAIFWFHPVVWWMESQLIKERERACDEEVLLLCHRPQAYAESILKVCELCIESPLTCVSGITGADLKRRIVQIMTAPIARKLGLGAKLLLLSAGLLVAAVPVLAGRGRAMRSLLSAPLALAGQVSPPLSIPTSVKLPEFEVATIKPNDPSKHPGATAWTQSSLDELKMMGSLKTFLKVAYGIEDVQIAGGPKWLDSDLFEIDAKTSLPASPAQIKLMLRALLEQRFKLSAHTGTKPLPIYSLVVAKGGPKLQPADANGPGGLSSGPTLVRGTLDTAQLAHLLTSVLGRTAIDNTGLKGAYKVDLTWASDDQPSGPSLFTAIQEQLGLKLEPTKGPVETLVIDHAEQPSMDGAELPNPPTPILTPVSFAQANPAPAPAAAPQSVNASADLAAYEVVSVKPLHPDRILFMGVQTMPDGIDGENVTVAMLVRAAFGGNGNLPTNDAVTGLPDWAKADYFSVQAKMSPDQTAAFARLDKNQQLACREVMLQALLADRFKLQVHRETRQVPAYELVVAKGGPKMKELTGPDPNVPIGPNGMRLTGGVLSMRPSKGGMEVVLQNYPLDQLAHFLGTDATAVGHQVVDKTGLTGKYSYTLTFAPSQGAGPAPGGGPTDAAAPDDAPPSIFTALEDQLGLKLQRGTGTVDAVVVDHVERPTQN